MILNEKYITQYFSNHLEVGWRNSRVIFVSNGQKHAMGWNNVPQWMMKKSKQNFSLKPSMEITESCNIALVKKQIQIAKC